MFWRPSIRGNFIFVVDCERLFKIDTYSVYFDIFFKLVAGYSLFASSGPSDSNISACASQQAVVVVSLSVATADRAQVPGAGAPGPGLLGLYAGALGRRHLYARWDVGDCDLVTRKLYVRISTYYTILLIFGS